MNPRKLFNVILKIFGLFFLREIINSIPQVFASIFRYFNILDAEPALLSLLISLLILAFYTFLVIQLLFKTNKIINMLKLDQGFDEEDISIGDKEEFSFQLSSTTIMTIALIVIGGVILVDEIPEFCGQFYLYFSQNSIRYDSIRPDASPIIFSAAKIVIALLILGERNRIVDFIQNRNTQTTEEEIETDQ